MFNLKLNGVFGTQTWAGNPFKADGRDILPALRKYQAEVRASELTTWAKVGNLFRAAFTALRNPEVRASELTTWGTIWRLAYVGFFVAVCAVTVWLWMAIA